MTPSSLIPSGLVALGKAQRYLDCSRATLRRLIRTGGLPIVTLAERPKRPVVRIAMADLEAFVQRGRSRGDVVSLARIAERRRMLTLALGGFPPSDALDVVADELTALAWQETLLLADEYGGILPMTPTTTRVPALAGATR